MEPNETANQSISQSVNRSISQTDNRWTRNRSDENISKERMHAVHWSELSETSSLSLLDRLKTNDVLQHER